jgi:ATP-dependent helicase HrpB
MNRTDLPIFQIEKEIVSRLRESNRLILQAPTGSGKSTQTPQFLLDHGLLGSGQVVVLQPRRLAARLLAKRVAEERGVSLGEEVGYQIRFDNISGPKTRIQFVTEGILLRRMISDSSLQGISAILFDEFHERHLHGDITLARALDIQETTRPDLKIVVMSATLQADLLENYLKPCARVASEGRTFPVEIVHIPQPPPEREPIWDTAVHELESALASGAEGDVLIFMPGAYEINRTLQAIRNSRVCGDCVALPLHGELPPQDQDAAVSRYPRRKIVVATNVAETSLTIDGIRLVIDSGLARIARFDPHRGINTLLIEKNSRASADQRAGRAGRTAPGKCLRLWTATDHSQRPAQELPEIRRLDLAETLLTLKAAGIVDVRRFRWLEAPEAKSLDQAEILLHDLGAVDRSSGVITETGRRMLAFPTHPRYARMLLAAHDLGCVRPVALIAALTQTRSLLLRSEGRKMDELRDDLLGNDGSSDFFRLMRAWRYADRERYDMNACRRLGIHAGSARQIGQLCQQFLRIAEEEGLDVSEKKAEGDAIQKCVLLGFSDQIARRCDGGTLRCELVHKRVGVLARESVVQDSPFLVVSEISEIQSSDRSLRVLLSLATAVQENWLRELFPRDFVDASEVVFDPTSKKVVVMRRRLFRDLELEAKLSENPPEEEAARLLAREVAAGRLLLKNWDDAVEQWIARVNCLSRWSPELEIPPIGEGDRLSLLEQICHGSTTYKDIKDHPVWPVLKTWLSAAQLGALDHYAPERYELPGGRRAKITYSAEGAPVLGARIQDLYGVTGDIRLAGGKVPVTIQVLAPSQRPLQVTQNLATFWKESYPKIKQELQRKYPRHEWR